MLALLHRLPVEHGCTLVLVTHDETVAAGADRVLHAAMWRHEQSGASHRRGR